jgi:4-amino-4-deoxy-L-arabinose transferase-like glycosyltransferase
MGFIKKHAITIAALILLAAYFLTRIYHILDLPIFTDEAIYVRWAQIAKSDANWRFISLTDGKQPLFIWIAMLLMKPIHDPLLAGRIVSVLAGLGSTIGMFFLASETFKNRKIGVLASALYILFPFALVYDRLALYDSLVSMFIIWSLFFEILLVRRLRLDIAMILGMIVGAGMLTKTNADFALILLPFSLILFNFKDKKWKQHLGKWIIFALVAALIANVMYAILRLSPFYHIIEEKNYTFIYPFKEWLTHPFTYLFSNFRAMWNWLLGYATAPFLVLILSAFLIGKKFLKENLLLFVWFIAPFMALAFFGRVIYPRHFLFMTMTLLVLGAYALYYLMIFVKKNWMKIGVFLVFTTMFFINDYFIVTDFAKANLPQSDRGQFITGWPAGIGVRESIDFFNQQSQHGKIYVGTEGTFGLMPYALEIYLKDNPNVTIKGFWPISETPPKEAIEASKKMSTYFVFYQDCIPCQATGLAPLQWKAKEVLKFKREDDQSYYTVYQLQ